jgi:hypothetical protein
MPRIVASGVKSMMMDGQARERRAGWPVAKFRLGEEPVDDLSAVTTAAERVAMMWPLAVAVWKMAGLAIPTYARHETPIRRVPLDST